MKLLTILALIGMGIYFPVACTDAALLQHDIAARDAAMARLARTR